jgi:hypothetical protein
MMLTMDSDDTSTIDDLDDAQWVASQRQIVVEYLASQCVAHGGVSLEPRWFLSPHLAIWAIRSRVSPDCVGWWAVSGDVPTDYMTCTRELDCGDVLAEFSKIWRAAAAKMANGEQLENCVLGGGDPQRAKELAPLLLTRAEALEKLAAAIKSGKPPRDA